MLSVSVRVCIVHLVSGETMVVGTMESVEIVEIARVGTVESVEILEITGLGTMESVEILEIAKVRRHGDNGGA